MSDAATGSGDAVAEIDGITGDVVIRAIDLDHPVTGPDVEPIGDVLEITTDGTVEAGASVTVEADEPIDDDEIVVAVTAESDDGPWEPLPVTVAGTRVTASIEHLSLFSFLRFPDPTDVIEELFNDVTSDLFAAAMPPSCEDEDGARTDGHEISSEGPDVLMWCLGRDGQGRYLRVVNNRRYPVIVSSPLPVREVDAAHGFGDRLSEALAGDRAALPPRAQITYDADLDPAGRASIRAEFDGLAYSLYQLQYGIELANAFLTRFGTQALAPGSLEALLASTGCVDALMSVSPGKILTSCLDFDGLSTLFGRLGAAILTPIFLTAGVLSFFQTAVGSLWDEISGRDNYTIALARSDAPSGSAGCPPQNPGFPFVCSERWGLAAAPYSKGTLITLYSFFGHGDRADISAWAPITEWAFSDVQQAEPFSDSCDADAVAALATGAGVPTEVAVELAADLVHQNLC